MRRSARTALCGGRSAMVAPTASCAIGFLHLFLKIEAVKYRLLVGRKVETEIPGNALLEYRSRLLKRGGLQGSSNGAGAVEVRSSCLGYWLARI